MRMLPFFAQGAAAAQTAGSRPPAEVRVVFVRDGVFTAPWMTPGTAIPETTYDPLPQMITPPNGGGSVSKVSVRATHDGEEVAIRLQWSDPSADRGVGVDTFRDAAAIGFPVGKAGRRPSPFMGDPEHPVVIWQWAADFDANAEGKSRFGERYPHSEGVWIFPQDLSVRRQVRGWRGAEPVIEYIARRFRHAHAADGCGTVEGISDYASGQWTLWCFAASSRRRKRRMPPLLRARRTQLIIAIWNGGEKEVNGRKSVTYAWIPARFDGIGPPRPQDPIWAHRVRTSSENDRDLSLSLDRARVYRALAQVFRTAGYRIHPEGARSLPAGTLRGSRTFDRGLGFGRDP